MKNFITRGIALLLVFLSSYVLAKGSEQQAWAFSMDNDLFVPGRIRDADFTGGFAFTYSGRTGFKYWQGLDKSLETLDRIFGAGIFGADIFGTAQVDSSITPSIEFGMYGFTPHKIEATEVVREDRPYASLIYLSASRIYPSSEPGGNAWSSSLTVGTLGLNVFGDIQNEIHKLTGSDSASGWDHQIADGGELTFRYQAAYHNYWDSNLNAQHFKTTYFASVGYLTEAGIALSTRQGLMSSSQRFNPELVSYGERVNELAMTQDQGKGSYFWGGISVKARAYNAFLQGQFKSSEHTLHSDELRPVLAEAWVGYTVSMGHRHKFSYFLRAQTSEIRQGAADRHLVWGGFVISR